MGGDGSTEDDNDLSKSDTLIVNELLASATHAIDTGKLTTDIVPSFVLFYDDLEVKSAHEALSSHINQCEMKVKLSTRSRKSDKDEAKSTDIKNIIDALRLIDWADQKVPFVVSDISRICHVYGALRDEIQMRSEMQRINQRLLSLEKLLQSIPNITSRIDTAITAINHTPPTTPLIPFPLSFQGQPRMTYKDKVTVNTQKAAPQIQRQNESTEDEVPTPPSPSWRTVATKRQHRAKKQPVVGNDDSSGLFSTDVRPLKLFVTRFHPDTKSEDMTNYLQNSKGWKVISIDKLKTKYDSYSSWKVVLNKSGLEKSEILKSESWPKGVLVRPFLTNRLNKEQLGRIPNSHAPQMST